MPDKLFWASTSPLKTLLHAGLYIALQVSGSEQAMMKQVVYRLCYGMTSCLHPWHAADLFCRCLTQSVPW